MEKIRFYGGNLSLFNPNLSIQNNLKDRFCGKPWKHFEIGEGGQVHACCPAWLPIKIGTIPRESITEIWNSRAVKAIRASVLNGTFTFCRESNCPLISGDLLPSIDEITDPQDLYIIQNGILEAEFMPSHFNLCYDSSCNLTCPSCRNLRSSVVDGPEYIERKIIQEKVFDYCLRIPHDKKITINITGSGDPFGSKLFRELLQEIDGSHFPNLVIDFQTNGVMFTRKYYDQIHKIHNNIGRVAVSFDAATQKTYEYTRRGGDWNTLLSNFRFLNELRTHNMLKNLCVDFVVQQANYTEMPLLLSLLKNFQAVDQINFSLINNWGTFSDEEFLTHAIWRKDHPEHESFLDILKRPELSDPKVSLGNVAPYRKMALNTAVTRIGD